MKKKHRTESMKNKIVARKAESKNRIGNFYERKENTVNGTTYYQYVQVKPSKESDSANSVGKVLLTLMYEKAAKMLNFFR